MTGLAKANLPPGPGETAAALIALHERLGLVYGAVDLVGTPAGEMVFLETNQAGEWGWLAVAFQVIVFHGGVMPLPTVSGGRSCQFCRVT